MEGNKDSAELCINISERYIREGKRDEAEKYLLKSERLYPTQKAKDLLESLQKLKSASNPGRKETSSGKETSSNTGTKKETSMPEVEYTKEQLEAVKRIKNCKDYYEILGINKEATDTDIKKAYKKLALVLHPDKNRAPGAAEAFKAIGNAVAVLTNVEKRKQYDLYGTDDERIRHNSSHGDSYTRGFEADVSPEELFNMFFGTSFPSAGNVYVRRGNRWPRRGPEEHTQQQHRDTNNYSILMQMLPLLILVALSMMSSLLVSDPVYSLTQNSKFPVMKTTMSLKVPYYVKENFASTYQGSIRRLEASVEEEFIANLRNACFREKQYRESLLWRARSYGDEDLFKKAQGMRTPSCETLNGYRVTH
ncbi:dnaJ homolog subfamily B member 12 [Halyomorpha halys]|uniref:dnaJ homolog subfamily B member 12 n=1 Tax=Halyomorpha halys TaxID=286706 RepID=UPI0006D4D829|nr:dnaJ homolog subfamily B member 12 [Halyomorpha halys]XP_014277379.1 dnaJ homolog subfamily B member 12 [Halyomorpha halys]XP_014277458.1 dnaJ homolog subfamily B member 12 [Halyomorpha halys]XP_014277534.1 dnaJ homolog subfamily B member 12 [Halyomorpha halys]XP_014277609.1 dnaJ homolog subfamily B member 12 [Halyomorpha halys]